MQVRRTLPLVPVLLALALSTTGLAAPSAGASEPLRVTDVAGEVGIAAITNDDFNPSCVADFDADGLSDLALGNHLSAPAEVFRGQSDGSFAKVQELPVSDRHGCAVADFDQDGRLDLFYAIGARKGKVNDKANEMWLQGEDGQFTLAPDALGTADPSGRGRAALAWDADGDAWPDLYIGNESPVDYPSYNRVFLNSGGTFADDPESGAVNATTAGNCAAAGDVDGDGVQELFACGGRNHLWVRTPGSGYADRAEAWGMRSSRASGAAWGDLNGDGTDDLVLVGGQQLDVYFGGGGQLTRGWSQPMTAARKVALADVDQDGALDIYVTQARAGGRGPNLPDVLLLGTGSGCFSPFDDLPYATTGAGNDVAVVPYEGRPALLVTNGGAEAVTGPRQLFVFSGTERGAPTVPGAPHGVTATADDASAAVSWTSPSCNGSGEITGYRVTASPGGATATVPAEARSALLGGLTNGTAYTFTVTAVNAAGPGTASRPSAPVTPLAPTRTVEETQVRLGGWTRVDSAAALGGSYRASTAAGDTAAFSFRGSEVTWLTTGLPKGGRADVLIDGRVRDTVDLHRRAATPLALTFGGLSDGTHRIVVRVAAGTSSRAVVAVDGMRVGPSTVDDVAQAISLNGWKGVSDAGASAGAYRTTSRPGDTATRTFSGTAVQLVTRVCPTCGQAQVLLDGVDRGVLDLYSATDTLGQTFSFAGLAPGSHTLSLEVLASRSPASSGNAVAVDALVVTP